MSGIAGIYYRDRRPVDAAVLRCMALAMAHRGRDGVGHWSSGSVALTQLMFYTVPEAVGEVQPVVGEDGSLCLTLDGRFDNREELRNALAGRGARLRHDTDSELLLRAYECWGEECPAKLLGDFAFALWDHRRRLLFCARDHMGIRPFYYYQADKLFAFASEIRGLLALDAIPQRLNEHKVADYFTDELAPVDQESTFYQNIVRLPAGHSLTVTGDRLAMRDYWPLEPGPPLKLRSWEEYGEAFREVFVPAVRCRLRSIATVGSTLSGGLDSSSVVCTVRELLAGELQKPLHTVSMVNADEASCGETPHVRAVLRGGRLTPHIIRSDHAAGYCGDLEQVIADSDEPWDIAPYVFNRILLRAARSAGIGVLLEGAAGDSVIPPVTFLAALLRRLEFRKLAGELRYLADRPAERVRALLYHGLAPFMPEVYFRLRTLARRPDPLEPPLAPAFAAKTQVVERCWQRRMKLWKLARDIHALHAWTFKGGTLSHYYETLNRAAARLGVEPRGPFSDRRVVEFFLLLPLDRKLDVPVPKMVVRAAMQGILPEPVRWRVESTHPGTAFVLEVANFLDASIRKEIARCAESMAEFVSINQLQELYTRYQAGDRKETVWPVWRTVVLSMWLNGSSLRMGFGRRREEA